MRGFTDRDGGRLGALVGLRRAAVLAVISLLATGATATIRVYPGTTVKVGQEVVFDANGFDISGMNTLAEWSATGTPGCADAVEGYYDWDFGDGYCAKRDWPYVGARFDGFAQLHYFMRPGTYTVALTVTDVGVKAAASLYLTSQPDPGDTFTLDAKVYTFDATGALQNIDGHIEIGTTLALTQEYVFRAILLSNYPHPHYAAAMTLHPTVTLAAYPSGNIFPLQAKTAGVAGNAIALDCTGVHLGISAGYLSGGAEIVSRQETVDITVNGTTPRLPPLPAAAETAWLKFEDNLTDSSGNGLNGTFSGTVSYVAQAMENKAVHLDDTERIRIADDDLLDGGSAFSISFWARKATATTTGWCMVKGPSLGNCSYYARFPAANAMEWQFIIGGGGKLVNSYTLNEIRNTSWHHYAVSYNGVRLKMYVDGVSARSSMTTAASGTVATNAYPLDIGSTGSGNFAGDLDEVKIWKGYGLTDDEVTRRFELRRANFHARTDQYVYAQIPARYTADTNNQLRVVLQGATYGPWTLVNDASSLTGEYRFVIEPGALAADTYTLTAQILNGGDSLLEERTDVFIKRTAGQPRVGINKDSSFVVDGNLFLPVCTFGLDWDKQALFVGQMNVSYNQGWYSLYTPATWDDFLDRNQARGWYVLGPGTGGYSTIGRNTTTPGVRRVNNSLQFIEDYAVATRDHAALFGWHTGDETDTGTDTTSLNSPVIAARVYRYQMLGNALPVGTNLAGITFLNSTATTQRYEYQMSTNGYYFGGRNCPIFDYIGHDIYPWDWRTSQGSAPTNVRVRHIVEINRNFLEAGYYNLVPMTACVEVSGVDKSITSPITPAGIKMLSWLHLVTGAKGIVWFWNDWSGHPTTAEQHTAMEEFYTQVQSLKDVILGPEPTRIVTRSDANNIEDNWVETMLREDGNDVYLFAVRLTEVGEGNDITPTFRITDVNYAATVTVIGETRDVNLTTDGTYGYLEDTFEPNAVHLYTWYPNAEASNPNAAPAALVSPAQGATNRPRTLTLRWTAGAAAVSHDVYFGTDSTPDETEFQGNQGRTATTFIPPTLAWNTTYYWRVDEYNVDGNKTVGAVWSFTTGARPVKRFLFFR
jgi:hypothetical protein